MKRTVDNTGLGNCMYYSYSISLMYYLLRIQDKNTAEKIFNKLNLTVSEKQKLHGLLDNKHLTWFENDQIKRIIEPILAPAARKVAAEQTALVFLQNPNATPSYAALNYRLIYRMRFILNSEEPQLARLLSNNNFDNDDYTNDEINNFIDENHDIQHNLNAHLQSLSSHIINQFKQTWPLRLQQIIKEKSTGTHRKTAEEISNDDFYQRQYLEELIGECTISFLTNDNNYVLNRYVQHLNTDKRWAGEETLLLLHRYLQGEQQVTLDNGLKTFEYDVAMSLAIYNDGQPKSGDTHHADIVLNNLGNVHWVSLVEPITRNVDISDNDVPPNPTPPENHSQTRTDYLNFCGFTVYLQQLKEKASALKSKYPLASKEVDTIFKEINKARKEFTAANSTLNPDDFIQLCKTIINTAPKSNIEQHRGIGKLLNGLLNALISLANVFVNIGNLFYGKYKLIDSNRLPTKTSAQVKGLEVSLNALLESKKLEKSKHGVGPDDSKDSEKTYSAY